MKRQILLAILITICVIASNATATAQITPDQIIDRFFEIYSKDPGRAIDYIFSTNKWFDQKKEDIDSLKFKLNEVVDSSGAYSGCVKIAEKSSSETLKLMVYYLKYERVPIWIDFFFYKPKDKWQLQDISFDEETLDNYLENTSKFSIPKEN